MLKYAGMTTTPKTGLKEAFNTAAARLRNWLDERKHGPHAQRREEMLARIEGLPGGKDLLQKARDWGVGIEVAPAHAIGGAHGVLLSFKDGGFGITIANTGNVAGMTLTLWHELRHMLQNAGPSGSMPHGGDIHEARTAHMLAQMQEADAFTAETLIAVREKKAGRPEYYEALLNNTGDSAMGCIRSFLHDHPPQSFPTEEAFARSLFAELMITGLYAYRAQFLGRIGSTFRDLKSEKELQEYIGCLPARNASVPDGLAAIYGGYFMSSASTAALVTAFWEGQPEDERQAVDLVEKTVRNAKNLTAAEFAKARGEIVQRMHELYMKDPEEGRFPFMAFQHTARLLREAAAADKVFVPAATPQAACR
jgi:hypothetical protein